MDINLLDSIVSLFVLVISLKFILSSFTFRKQKIRMTIMKPARIESNAFLSSHDNGNFHDGNFHVAFDMRNTWTQENNEQKLEKPKLFT